MVLTWSQAAPAGPLLYLEAIQIPPQFHNNSTRKPWRFFLLHGSNHTLCALMGSQHLLLLCSCGKPSTLNGGLHFIINTHTSLQPRAHKNGRLEFTTEAFNGLSFEARVAVLQAGKLKLGSCFCSYSLPEEVGHKKSNLGAG